VQGDCGEPPASFGITVLKPCQCVISLTQPLLLQEPPSDLVAAATRSSLSNVNDGTSPLILLNLHIDVAAGDAEQGAVVTHQADRLWLSNMTFAASAGSTFATGGHAIRVTGHLQLAVPAKLSCAGATACSSPAQQAPPERDGFLRDARTATV
jgi:hypothetical protein